MKRRTYSTELMAAIEQMVDLKIQMKRYKVIATQHNVTEHTIRRLIWAGLQKRTNVSIHVKRPKVDIEKLAKGLMHDGC
jgi:hypothetical protein